MTLFQQFYDELDDTKVDLILCELEKVIEYIKTGETKHEN